jgi:adenylate cyclase
LIASLDKELLFDTRRPQLHSVPFPFPKLTDKAETNDGTYAFVVLDRELYAIAVAPLLAPDPIAWLCPMFRIDDDFAREIKVYTNLEITFLNGADLFGTTLPNQSDITQMLRNRALPPKQVIDLRLAREIFVSYVVPLPAENAHPIALLQRSLDKELAPYLRLEQIYLILALLGLGVSAILGLWIARGVSRPVLELASGAREIAAGNYNHRGEFSDLRNFTRMSEALGPEEMLAILNHYFTRMAAIVEKRGGVVDKYVGDALMALFGAPVASADDADRALH